MTKKSFRTASLTGLMACSGVLIVLTGCVTAGPGPRSRYPARPVVVQTTG